jgi:hypothetical protein
MMAGRCLTMVPCVLFLPGTAFADMMERPWFGPADSYWAAYMLGLILLALSTLVTWFILRALKRKPSQRFLLCRAVLVAIIGGLVLREDYQVSRAESCFYFLQRAIRRGDRHAAMHGYGRGAVSTSIHPGGVWSTFATPPELVAFLRRKYSNPFSGSLVRIRNALCGCELPNEEELSEVENMPVAELYSDYD